MVERDDYMREGFDPSSLTMPQLRGILVEHDVPFGSALRKAELVDLFNRNVLPKTASLRKKKATIVASSSGIIDMRDGARSDTEVTPEQTPAKRKPGRPRKSEASTPASQTPAKTPAKSARKKSSLGSQVVANAESEAEAEEVVEQPVKRPRGRPRKSASTEAAEPDATTSPRRVTFGTSPDSPPASSRKAGRLSLGAGGSGRRSDDDGTFSDSNPFQSGSEASPASGIAAKAAVSARKARRKTTDGTSTLRKKASDQHLAPSPPRSARKSAPGAGSTLHNYMDQSIASATPPRIVGDSTVASSKDTSTYSGAEADADDDFDDLDTFTSPSALAKMRILRRKRDKQRRKGGRAERTLADHLIRSVWMMVCVGAIAWTMWYARETRALGFCDTNSDTNAIVQDRQLTALAFARANNESVEDTTILPERFQPSCTPCPPHASCAHGQVVGCSSDDWVLQPNLRSHVPLAKWVLPLRMTAPRCYPDTQKLVLASELAQAVSHMLADFKGEIVCGTQKTHATVKKLPKKLVAENGNLTYAIAEQAVKRSMSATRDARVDDDYFEQIWYMALFELTDPRSNIVRVPVSAASPSQAAEEADELQTEYFLAAKQPTLTLACRSRLALRGWMLRARLYVFALLSAVLGLSYLRYRVSAARAESAKVATLVQAALERLQEQEYLHGLDPVLYPDDFVPLSHLRDHILSEEHQAKARNRLWKKVARVVEENSNVRTRQAQKKGEWLRVWQWVGVESFRGYSGTPTLTPQPVA